MKTVAWEYCECGCHGSSFLVAGLRFWMYDDLKGTVFLHQGHGWMSPLIGKFKSKFFIQK